MQNFIRTTAGLVAILLLAVTCDALVLDVPGWLPGNAHTHSDYSDGESTVAQMANSAKALGFEWLYMTDHSEFLNTAEWDTYLTDCQNASSGILVLAGVEFNTDYSVKPRHHYVGYGLANYRRTVESTGQDLINLVASLGGFGYIAHPTDASTPWDDLSDTGYTGLEVWNETLSSEAVWSGLLQQGRRIYGTAVSDAHRPEKLTSTFMYLKADPTGASVTQALRTGKIIMSRGPFINLQVGTAEVGEVGGIPYGQTSITATVAWVNDGQLATVRVLRVDSDGTHTPAVINTAVTQSPVVISVPVNTRSICLRLQGTKTNGDLIALTNPIWIPPAGDINGDGYRNISDARLCLGVLLNRAVTIDHRSYSSPYPAWLTQAADINGNGHIDISDLMLILQESLH